jgi:phospholipid/cholesterol/gamma-HCH transport system substrate-binding protein
MSNEVKIGILAVAAIALSFWGYKFILGKNMLVKSNVYKVYYQDVEGLQIGTPVRIHGVEVGSVASIQLLPEEERVLVILDLQRAVQIPKNTKAIILSTGFMGSKAIALTYPTPCSGPDCARSGDFIEGESRGLLGSMFGEDNIRSYVGILKEGLTDVLDSLNALLLSEDSDSPLAKSARDLSGALANLNSTTSQLDLLMRRSSGDIDGTLSNLNEITGTIASQKGRINSILVNADSLSAQLAEADLKHTLIEVNSAITDLKSTLKSADAALAGVSDAVGKINEGEGSLGKLLKDDELYRSLNSMSTQADSLFEDFQERPYRYMPFKSRRKVKRVDRLDAKQGN